MAEGAFKRLASKLAQPDHVKVSRTSFPAINTGRQTRRITPQRVRALNRPGNDMKHPRVFMEGPGKRPLSDGGR